MNADVRLTVADTYRPDSFRHHLCPQTSTPLSGNEKKEEMLKTLSQGARKEKVHNLISTV